MVSKTIIGSLCLTSLLISSPVDFQISGSSNRPTLKSGILPGWGEMDLGAKKRAKVFFTTEMILWVSFFESKWNVTLLESKYKTFATDHAGIQSGEKEDYFFVDIGNYDSIEMFNETQLRYRNFEELYPIGETYEWNWDSDGNRIRFRDMRIRRDMFRKSSNFILGGIVVNHLLSVLDVKYLQKAEPLSFDYFIEPLNQTPSYHFQLSYTFPK